MHTIGGRALEHDSGLLALQNGELLTEPLPNEAKVPDESVRARAWTRSKESLHIHLGLHMLAPPRTSTTRETRTVRWFSLVRMNA